MFGGRGADDAGRLGDEVGDVRAREGRVEATLEADRRRRLRAHRLAAQRPRHVPGVDLDTVPELDEAPQRVEETLRSLARVDREIGSRGVSHEQRVAGEHEPGLRGPRAVDDREAAVLRAGGPGVWMQRRTTSPTEISLPSSSGSCGYSASAAGWIADGEVVLEREPAVARDVVGVGVGLDRPNDANPASLGFLEVLLDRERRIDDDRLPRALVADQVRSAAKSVVDELREDHSRRRN